MAANNKFHLHAENRRPMGGHRKGDAPTVLQGLWRTCCQSSDEHRFDCTAVPPEKRGAGPVRQRGKVVHR
jgi:hypothetical protein